MSTDGLQECQRTLTNFIRDPEAHPGPPDVEARRLTIYRDLFFNTVEAAISGSFPVCRSLFEEAPWRQMLRDFLRLHRCQTPFYSQLPEEFLHYLNEQRDAPEDPPFLLELAHYEWMEVVLDISCEALPAPTPLPAALLDTPLRLSPLARPLAYRYPVHCISATVRPAQPLPEPCHLLVYRNRQDVVAFMEINAVTARLLLLLDGQTPRQALAAVAAELGMAAEGLEAFGLELLAQFYEQDIVIL